MPQWHLLSEERSEPLRSKHLDVLFNRQFTKNSDLIGISDPDPLTIHALYHSIERLNSEAVVKQLQGELRLPVRSWYPAESGLPPTFLLVHLVKRTRGWMC